MTKNFILRFLIVLALITGIIGTIGVVYAQQVDEGVYRVCVDQRGNIRLLMPDINGNFSDKPKQNEFEIKLPSIGLYYELAEDVSRLWEAVGEQEDRVTDLEGTVSGLQSEIETQISVIGDLQSTAEGQADEITTLWEKIAELEGNSGNPGNPGNIITEGLILHLPLYELNGDSFISKDDYGHACTASGAYWTSHGHYFDGVNDNVSIAHHTSLNPSAEMTHVAWIYPDSFPSVTNRIFDKLQSYAISARSNGEITVEAWSIDGNQTS